MQVRVVLMSFVAAAAAGVIYVGAPILAQITLPVATQDETGDVVPAAAEELGRLLFWDPILSGNKDVACATCHHPDLAYADGRDLSRGAGSIGLGPKRRDTTGGAIPVVKRNSPTLVNVGFNGLGNNRRRRQQFDGIVASVNQLNAPMFWDNRLRSLELQALEPIKALEEMRGTAYPEDAALDTVVARLQAIPQYGTLFERAFGPGAKVTPPRIGQAIAAFERTLVAMNSPFDRFRAGDSGALTAQQQRGMQVFDNAGCDRCHDGAMFSDFDLHAEGVAEHPLLAAPDAGGGRFRFRTPSLRNVALTAPYMHNGTLATLKDVLNFYDNGRSENPNVSGVRRRNGGQRADGRARLDRDFQRVDDMSERDMQDIIAFLEALTDARFDRTIPPRVPSGLPPGGLIRNR